MNAEVEPAVAAGHDSAPDDVPRQLPAPPPVFTGRAAELAELDRAPDAGAVVITAIDGMAGIGKTALAVHAAHQVAGAYPDGQLFVDLHGFTEGMAPVEPEDALEQLRPCLDKLVPIMQRAMLDYLTDPGPTNTLIVEIVEAYQTGWTYSPGVADYAVRTMREQGLVTNDPASGVFGQFDPARMQQIVATVGPLMQADGTIPQIPSPDSLYTNEFIDPSIRMS